ncbi:hypothetical protein TRAPUB_7616, partial [Trametes pubescens]
LQRTLSFEQGNSLPKALNHVKAHSGDTNPQGRLWRAEKENARNLGRAELPELEKMH